MTKRTSINRVSTIATAIAKPRFATLLAYIIYMCAFAPLTANAQTGAFNITGTASGWSYSNSTLTITANGTYTIGMTTTNAVTDKIVVQSGVNANITLDGVSIDVSGTSRACAFDMSGATVNLTLQGTNTLKSGEYRAGLHVPASAMVTISGSGTLNAYGGHSGAGIGGALVGSGAGGTVNISGGTVNAVGNTNAADIGGAGSGAGGTVNITGGTVTATNSTSSMGIGGGGSGGANGTLTMNGGVVFASAVPSAGNRISGILFIGSNNPIVYDYTTTVSTSFTIPSGRTLTFPSSSTLTLNSGATITNQGAIVNNGTITINGAITNTTGTITNNGTIAVNGAITNNSGGTVTNNSTINVGESGSVTNSGTFRHTVTYNANGGSGAPGVQYKNHGSDLTLSSTIPTRTDYTFTGWNTAAGGGGSGFTAGGNFDIDNAVTLYAQWTPTPPVLSYVTINRTSDEAAAVSFTTDLAGTAYYLVQNSGEVAPTNTAVKTANQSLGTVSAGLAIGLPITLTVGAKDIYVVVENALGAVSEPLKFAAAAYDPNATGVRVNDGGILTSVDAIAFAIGTALNTSDIVTVTGELSGVTDYVAINISAEKKIVWSADYSGSNINALVWLQGDGVFEVTGGQIKNDVSTALYVMNASDNLKVTVTGGNIESTGNGQTAIRSFGKGSLISVTGGRIKSGEGGDAIDTYGSVYVGGTAQIIVATNGVGYAVYMLGLDTPSTFTMDGGTIIGGIRYAVYLGSDSKNITAIITGGTLSNNTNNASPVVYAAGATSSNHVIFWNGGTITPGGSNKGTPLGVSASTNGIAIEKTGTGAVYEEGTSNDLIVQPANATAVWAIAGGVSGIAYAKGTNYSGFIAVDGVTVNEAPPVLSAGSVRRTSDTEATIGFHTNKVGNAYYLVVESGADAPAKEAVRAAVDFIGTASGTVSGRAVTLTSGAKDIYVVVQDNSNNLSLPLKIEVTTDLFFGGGAGTQEDPYLIRNAAELDAVREHDLEHNYLDKYFKLANDIDLTAYLASGGAGYAQWGAAGWSPIGKEGNNSNWNRDAFKGTFDGDGHTISGLYINNTSTDTHFFSLFGKVSGATIKNLGVTGVNITSTSEQTGAIAGRLETGTVIMNCYSTGTISAPTNSSTNAYVGGIVGVVSGSSRVENSYSLCDISTNREVAGGIAGEVQGGGSIVNCYAAGSVTGRDGVGGVVGLNTASTVQNCVAANSGITATISNVNRLVGRHTGSPTYRNNYANRNMTITMNGKSSPREDNALNGMSYPLDELKQAAFYTNAGFWYNSTAWDFTNVWTIDDEVSLPVFKWQVAPTYGVSIVALENGTVELDKNPADYAAGATVTLTVTPEESYELLTISAYKTGDAGTTVETQCIASVPYGTATYEFTMPAFGVTVTATFEQLTSTNIDNITNAKAIVSESYYDLTGKPASATTKGFVIKRTVYDDGSVIITKSYEL